MSKNTPTLLKTAAELRSCGASWAAVGRTVGRSPRTCAQWPRLFRSAWDGLYNDAEGRRFTETGGEATAVLQGLLRDGDNKMKLRSADVILRTRHQRLMREPATAPPGPSKRLSETLVQRRASVPLAQADCLQKQLLPEASTNSLDEKRLNPESPADESPPAVANDPNDDVLPVSARLLSDAVPLADPDPAALPTPAVACPAPSKSSNGSLRGMAFGVLLLISMLLLTALSQRQNNANERVDSSENDAREAARYRAIPLDIKLENVLNPAVFATRLSKCCSNKLSDTMRLSAPVASTGPAAFQFPLPKWPPRAIENR